MNKPHKHATLIKAWADGAEIEYLNLSGIWSITDDPVWYPETEYRIKPEKEYPKSALDYSDLCALRNKAHNDYTISKTGEGWDTYFARAVADAAVRRYIIDEERNAK